MSNILQKAFPLLVVLALVGLGGAGYFYYQYTKVQKEIQTIRTDPTTLQNLAKEEAKKLVSDVGKLIALPEGEEPTVATITDIEKLKDQPFFQRAKNGDKVLIYTNAKKAFLFDPKANKIIDVAPVNIGTPSAQEAQPRIVLKNGTAITGLTNRAETDLKKAYPQANIVSKENASKNDYEKSVVVVLNESTRQTADTVAKALNISIGDLPEGESKPDNADILVIIGADRT